MYLVGKKEIEIYLVDQLNSLLVTAVGQLIIYLIYYLPNCVQCAFGIVNVLQRYIFSKFFINNSLQFNCEKLKCVKSFPTSAMIFSDPHEN